MCSSGPISSPPPVTLHPGRRRLRSTHFGCGTGRRLRELAGAAVRGRMDQKLAAVFGGAWTQEHIGEREREWFRALAERELLSLHEGNFARYQITPAEFAAWQDVWSR